MDVIEELQHNLTFVSKILYQLNSSNAQAIRPVVEEMMDKHQIPMTDEMKKERLILDELAQIPDTKAEKILTMSHFTIIKQFGTHEMMLEFSKTLYHLIRYNMVQTAAVIKLWDDLQH